MIISDQPPHINGCNMFLGPNGADKNSKEIRGPSDIHFLFVLRKRLFLPDRAKTRAYFGATMYEIEADEHNNTFLYKVSNIKLVAKKMRDGSTIVRDNAGCKLVEVPEENRLEMLMLTLDAPQIR